MIRIVRRSLSRRFAPFALALLIAAGAQAANVSSTLTLNGTTTISGTGYVNAGQITLTITGSPTLSGTFASTIPFSAITGSTVAASFTITLSGGTLIGTYTEPVSILGGTSGTASATIGGGTGSYGGYTASYPTLAVTSSGSGLSFTFTSTGTGTINTTGGGTTTTPPAISSVQDGASNTADIAQGEFLSIYGTNLTPSSSGATDFPRPKFVGSVKVTFTPAAGGAGTDVYLIGIYKASGYDQINALLPSTVPVGNYNVTVTNGTATSSPFPTKVVASKPGLFTQDQTGSGLAVVFNYISQSESDVDRLTTGNYNGSLSSPAKPGQALVAWGTGIGPYQPGDNTAGISHDFSKSESIAAIVGGVSIPVDFAGLNGYAGEDQINFTLPANVPTGCSVTLQISVAGVLSAPTSISIAPAGATACVSSTYTTQQLQALDQGGTITHGGFTLDHGVTTAPSSATIDSISGGFGQTTGYQLSSSDMQYTILANSGGCVVSRFTSTNNTVTAGHSTSFDAGTVTLTGPSGTNLNSQKLTEISNIYLYTIGTSGGGYPGQGNGAILAGTYSLTGAGGTDVGPFSTSITIGPPLTLNSPLPTTVTESAGLTLNWTGGNAPDVVEIDGQSSTTSGTGTNEVTTTTSFVCTTTAGQKTFTVPASILTWLPTITAAQVAADTASGSLEVQSWARPATSFNTTLTKDGSTIPSSFSSTTSISGSALYQ
jgi:uncharacterized protein (TIGR03437 family)